MGRREKNKRNGNNKRERGGLERVTGQQRSNLSVFPSQNSQKSRQLLQ